MPTLTIRNVTEETHQALRERAAANGRSMEAEVRAMLDERVKRPPLTGAELLRRISARKDARTGRFDLDLPPRAPLEEPGVDFSGSDFDHWGKPGADKGAA